MRCEGSEFRHLGRNTMGVRGLKLRENDEIASLIVLDENETNWYAIKIERKI